MSDTKIEDMTPEEARAAFNDALTDGLTPEQVQRVEELVQAAPRFKPVKALTASGKMEFAAAFAKMSEIQGEFAAAEYDSSLTTAYASVMVAVCETALRVLASNPTHYDVWSAGIDMDLILPVIITVFERQGELMGKSGGSDKN